MNRLIVVTCAGAAMLAVILGVALWQDWESVPGFGGDRNKPGRTDLQVGLYVPDDFKVAAAHSDVAAKFPLPFLHRELGKKAVNVVAVEGAGISFVGRKSTYKNTALTRGTVVVLARTGQLVRAEFHGPDGTVGFPGQGSVEQAEESYRSCYQKYEGLPNAAPALSIQEILNRIFSKTAKSIHKSQRIEAVYVVHSQEGIEEPAPVWIVNFFGFPAYPGRGLAADRVPAAERSHFRFFVSAEGHVLGGDNQP